jgi:anthranilate synthase/aminodeoxychorismate synthase-like glutamine amidotransferase
MIEKKGKGKKMILMIDNYDSFTYNLVEYLKMLKREVKVVRNDKIDINEIRQLNPSIIVISPGPCTPNEAGISKKIISELKSEIPILGICLGHQAIGEVFGAKVVKAIEPVHGKVSSIRHNNLGVFKGLNNLLKVTRYHSLVIKRDTLPKTFEITAETELGEIMGIQHKVYPIVGVQFHPEAILTEQGLELLRNFLEIGENYDCKKN